MSVYWGGLHNLQSLQDAIEHPGDARWYNTDDGEAFDSYDRARQDVLTTQGVVNAPPGVTLEPKVVSGTVVNNTSGGGGDGPDDEYADLRILYRRARRYQKQYEEVDKDFRDDNPNLPLKGNNPKNIQEIRDALEKRSKETSLTSQQQQALRKYSDALTELRDVVKEMYHTITGEDKELNEFVPDLSGGGSEATSSGATSIGNRPGGRVKVEGQAGLDGEEAESDGTSPARPPFPDFPQPPATPLQS